MRNLRVHPSGNWERDQGEERRHADAERGREHHDLGGDVLDPLEVAVAVGLSDDRHRRDADALRQGRRHVDDRLAEGNGARHQRSGRVVDEQPVGEGEQRLDHAQHQRRERKGQKRPQYASVQDQFPALFRALM